MKQFKHGFTLIELLITLAILVFLVFGVATCLGRSSCTNPEGPMRTYASFVRPDLKGLVVICDGKLINSTCTASGVDNKDERVLIEGECNTFTKKCGPIVPVAYRR